MSLVSQETSIKLILFAPPPHSDKRLTRSIKGGPSRGIEVGSNRDSVSATEFGDVMKEIRVSLFGDDQEGGVCGTKFEVGVDVAINHTIFGRESNSFELSA